MKFRAFVKAIKADVAKHELTISFRVSLDDETMADAEELAQYVDPDAGAVELEVLPYQRSFVKKLTELTRPKD
jgi:hypothetical protein